ncbi:Hypothetical protein SMB2099_2122 [Serratia marcescens SMB2099]|nr:Hypothetical protein SMB2099_2122 [Serratia marcescens SMB2099]
MVEEGFSVLSLFFCLRCRKNQSKGQAKKTAHNVRRFQ